ncbi:MAG: 5-oxoprolinase subunit PxpB [Vicinamibacterales bacterium]|nr:5-oxoprolinase subunit PxpB [Vicinamibacterales bacterium]
MAVEFGDGIDVRINARVRLLQQALRAGAHAGIVEMVPTYRSLMVHYDPMVLAREALADVIMTTAGRLPEQVREAARTVEIPVKYGGEAGPDLADVAAAAGVDEQAVAELHAGGEYVVFMLGFMPGFPYLGGLPPGLAMPRLASPRAVVPAGSVGIAGAQTGIYPTESPGGWRIIGRTPVCLFDPLRSPPALLEAGDHVRFVPVGQTDYDAIAREVQAGTYRPASRTGSGGR